MVGDSRDSGSEDEDRKRTSRRKRDDDDDDDDYDKRISRREADDDDEDRRKRKSRRRDEDERRKKKHRKQKDRKRKESSDSDGEKVVVVNTKLLDKLSARGETIEEREARRAQRRAARITQKFGYTADSNPFNDPNLHEAFSWKKKEERKLPPDASRHGKQDEMFDEIEKVRQRRRDRDQHFEEMERLRAEESRMKELENYDEWARKEEEFHLQQQRQRSAIRLVEGREKPVDVLAKNLLMFGLSDEEKKNRAAVKYQEKYNALNELDTLEAELEEPYVILKHLKLEELEELLSDIDSFRKLEREATRSLDVLNSAVLKYWDDLFLVTQEEISFLKSGGVDGARAQTIMEIRKLFEGQLLEQIQKMKNDVEQKLQTIADSKGVGDLDYWRTVLDQLQVHIAKMQLSDLHSKMLVRQLERVEKKKEELLAAEQAGTVFAADAEDDGDVLGRPKDVNAGFGDLEEELGLNDEIGLTNMDYAVDDKFRHRKPRYFNRVKTGYDWNKYNQTHYDHDNPPPKTVQGYKFNIFYPDLLDVTKTPQYTLHKADTDEFLHHSFPCWSAVRRHRLQDYQSRVEQVEEARLSLHF